MRDIERRITDLKKKLASLAPGRIQRTEVKVSVIASQDLDAELAVTYQVGSAAWTPTYSARLDSGSRSLPAKLTLTRRALVQQSTDEVWDDVILELSTTRPAARSSAPKLSTLTVDINPPPPTSGGAGKHIAPARVSLGNRAIGEKRGCTRLPQPLHGPL